MPKKNTTFEFYKVFNDDQIKNLKYGNIPKAMEDKWFYYYSEWLKETVNMLNKK